MTLLSKEASSKTNGNGQSHNWTKLTRRLQEMALGLSKSHDGYSIMSVKILIDENGEPVFWTRPQSVRVEKAGIQDDLLEQLCEK